MRAACRSWTGTESVGEPLLESGDLRCIQIRQNREWQSEPCLVGSTLKILRIEGQRLPELLTNLRDEPVGNTQTRPGTELLPLNGRKPKLFSFGLRE